MAPDSDTIWHHNRVAAWGVRLLCPPDGARAFMALYAYFRWADDVVDAPDRDTEQVVLFVADQQRFLAGARGPERPIEHTLLDVLRGPLGAGLRPAVSRMWEALQFDSTRDGGALSAADLDAQVTRIGEAWMVALWVCLMVEEPLYAGLSELSRAASLVHVLRDRALDRTLGYRNTPPEVDSPMSESRWVRARGDEAYTRFDNGSAALRQVRSWRARALLGVLTWRYRTTLRRVLAELEPGEATRPG